MREQWRLHCTSQWGWRMPLSEHVYCVAIAFKMTEQVQQWICIKFCIKLEHLSMETIQMIQKDTDMVNWWLAASSQQRAHSFIMSFAECFVKPQITQVTQPHYSPDLVPCDFWLFPKLKSPLKGKGFQMRFRKIWWGSWWWLGELVPRCLLWKGLRCHCPMYNISCIFFNECLYFS